MTTLDRVLGAGLLVDSEYTIVDANEQSEVVFRTETDRILDKTLGELHDDDVIDSHTLRAWKASVTAVLDGLTTERTEQITLRPYSNDEQFRYDLTITPISGEGYPEQVCCSLRSVGPSAKYGETVRALENATQDLMTAGTVDDVLERTAVAAKEALSFPGIGVRKYNPRENVLEFVSFGARVEDIETRPAYSVTDSPQGRALLNGETVIDDIDDDDPYDREVFTQTMYVPIGARGTLSVGTVGNTFDETDIQFAEILAENANAALRVVNTTSRLREERERLELLRQILTRALRHNLRNDMSVIRGNADLLRERTGDEEAVLIDNILSAVEDVAALSDKADVFETITARAQSRQRVDIGQQIANAVTDVSREYPDVTFDVTCDDGTIAYAHSSLDIALVNLLENACEYTEDVVTVQTTETTDAVTVTITDDGPGIPDLEVAVLETHSETALEHSDGLGLWVVKWIVEHSDGSLEFDASDGTQVTITLDRVRGDSVGER